MELKKAIKRVVALYDSASIYKGICFYNNWVYVSNSVIWSACHVTDQELPNCVLDITPFKELIKSKSSLFQFSLGPDGKSGIIDLGSQGVYNISILVGFNFPVLPIFPKETYQIHWDFVSAVLSVIPKSVKNGGIPYLHITPKYIEGTDRVRLMRFRPIIENFDGVLPISLFNKWPKKEDAIFFGANDHFIYFILGEEVRITLRSSVDYPDTEKAISNIPVIGRCVINRDNFCEIVNQAACLSEVGGVHFDFYEKKIGIRSLNRTSISDNFVGEIDVSRFEGEKFGIGVNGLLLVKTLRALKAVALRVSYAEYPNPLRFTARGLDLYMWPMIAL